MARYTDSKCKLCRNEGAKLFLKGERCHTVKCSFERRSYRSGQHGQARRKLSEYATQLREKQKLRRTYGLLEKPFYRLFSSASRRKGDTGTVFLQSLEARLDNLVYRAGFAVSRSQARQLVTHGHFNVNAHRVDIPSYQVKPGDTIGVRERSQALIKSFVEINPLGAAQPHWLSVDANALSVVFSHAPVREDLDSTIREQLIIEYYSR